MVTHGAPGGQCDGRRISCVILTWLLLLVSHTPTLQRNSTALRVMFHGLESGEVSDGFEARKRRLGFPETTNVWKVSGHKRQPKPKFPNESASEGLRKEIEGRKERERKPQSRE
ncbi:hypothetical protein SRHO_G00143550 [Serrasalmus rhombeus]